MRTRKSGQGNPCETGDVNDRIIKEIICNALKIESFDEGKAEEGLDHIDVFKKEKFVIYLKDGTVIEEPYRKVERCTFTKVLHCRFPY